MLRSATIDISLEFSSTLIEACTTGQFDPHTVTRTLRRAKFSILCSYLTAPLTSDINVSKILNFNHYSYLTAHLDSVLRSAKIDISHENFNHYSYLTAHLDYVLRSAKFNNSREFT